VPGLAASDALPDQAGEQGRFTAQVAQPRSLGHFFHSCRSPVYVVAGLQPELTNELSLRPAIAFTKWMGGVQLADEVGGAVDKVLDVKSNEMLLGCELRQNLLQRGFEKSRQPKEMASLRDVHGPKLSRPFVHILENEPMDRFQMRDIESACNGIIDQLRNASMGLARFKAFQEFRVSEIAQVLEDACAGIEIRFRILGH